MEKNFGKGELKDQFKSLLLNSQEYSANQEIESLFLNHRSLLTKDFILDLSTKENNLKFKFRYLLLGFILSLKSKEEYQNRWGVFYEIINQILKVPIKEKQETKIEAHTFNLVLFMIDLQPMFFADFSQSYRIVIEELNQNTEDFVFLKRLGIKNIVKIFNSLLCFQSLSLKNLLELLALFCNRSGKATEFINEVEQKFIKRISCFQKQFTNDQISTLLSLFANPNLKKQSIEKQIGENHQKKQNKKQEKGIELQSNESWGLIFILKQASVNLNLEYRREIISRCLSLLGDINEEVYEFLLKSEGNEEDREISDLTFNYLKEESFKLITISRVKALLSRLNFNKKLSVELNFEKNFKVLRLALLLAKKYNESNPVYHFTKQSMLRITQLKKATMIIFTLDLLEPQNASVLRFFVEKQEFVFSISLRKCDSANEIQITVQTKNEQILKQKKMIHEWSYILCMISIKENVLQIGVDGAYFQLLLKRGGSFSQLKFGPFSGSLKDLMIMDKNYSMPILFKEYVEKFRKVSQVLESKEQKTFLFTFEKKKKSESSIFQFFKSKVEVQFVNIRKLSAISFENAVEELGGLPSLLFLMARTVTEATGEFSSQLLIEFFTFLKQVMTEMEEKVAMSEMLKSTAYFGQFLWLLVCRNEALRSSKTLFNHIFDLLDWFCKMDNLELTDSIIKNIYFNFEIWAKCIYPIRKVMLKKVYEQLGDESLCIKMLKAGYYEKVTASLLFYFLGGSHNEQSRENESIYLDVSSIASQICKIYEHPNIQYNESLVKRDINALMSMISSFFYKKRHYYSDDELKILEILTQSLKTDFLNENVMEKTRDLWIYIIYELSFLVSKSIQQTDVIVYLLELGFTIVASQQFLRTASSLLINSFTLSQQRKKDSLDFCYKCTLQFIRACQLFDSNSFAMDKEKLLSIFLENIMEKGEQNPKMKISSEIFVAELIQLNQFKLILTLSYSKFAEIVNKYVSNFEKPLVISFLSHRILTLNLFPQCAALMHFCIDSIYQYLSPSGSFKQKQGIASKVASDLTKEEEQTMKLRMMEKQKQIPQTNEYLSEIVSSFQTNNLSDCLLYCRSRNLLQILITFQCLNSYGKDWAFQLPLNVDRYLSIRKDYGGDLGTIFRWASVSANELEILNKWYISILGLNEGQEKSWRMLIIPKASEGHKYFVLENAVMCMFPLFLITNFLRRALSSPDDANEALNMAKNIPRLIQNSQMKAIFGLANSCKAHKSKIESAISKQFEDSESKAKFLYELSRKIMDQFQVQNNAQTSEVVDLNNLKSQLQVETNVVNYLKHNKKFLDKFSEELGRTLLLLQNLVKAFQTRAAASKSEKYLNLANSRSRKSDSKKFVKAIEISDLKFYEPYSEKLKKKAKQICLSFQKQNNLRQEKWKKLAKQNMFWSSFQIKNNECYQIDQKITGFYRLNIIKKQFDEVPYPRRKSFQYELADEKEANVIDNEKPSMHDSIQYFFPEEDEEFFNQEPLMNQVENVEAKSKIQFVTEYVTQKGVYAGKLYFLEKQGEKFFIFHCHGYSSLPQDTIHTMSTLFHRINDLNFKIQIKINSKTEIFNRRYILRATAVEIFSFHRSYFFNFFTKEEQFRFFKAVSTKATLIIDLRDEFEKRMYTQRWIQGEFDNFEYLMLINKFSGRTYNDLGQYPVMPWVIINYDDKQVEMNKEFMKNQKNMRNLSFPSGKINKQKFEKLKMRCEEIDPQDKQIRFLYGTMYSNPTVIYNFFIRLEPFTSLHWEHQGKKIDHADRLFSSIKQQFTTVLNSSSDNKQLTPEFYYWPQFLKNRNKVNLGIRQNHEQVHSVKLPGWAKNYEEFVFKMREALESSDVTENIHQWIDLIFGYKNPYQVAEQYDNLFHFRCYEQDIFQIEKNEQSIKGAQISISQFGQVPFNIFTEPHPPKAGRDEVRLDKCFAFKKASSKTILGFEINCEGMILYFPEEVELFTSDIKRMEIKADKGKKYKSNGGLEKVYDLNRGIWISLNLGIFRIYEKKACLFEQDLEARVFSFFGRFLIYGFKSELIISFIKDNYTLDRLNFFYGHENNIYIIETSVTLDLIVSVDENGLVLLHEFQKQTLLRQFKIKCETQILSLRIHEMGYFIFLTKNQRLLIFTYFGELFLDQDICVSSKGLPEKVTSFEIISQNRPLLLLGTSLGNLYLVNFLEIKRFSECYPFKSYSRIRTNVLEKCQVVQTSTSAIKQFSVNLVIGDTAPTYKIYVLYENNAILCFYQSEILEKRIKQSKNLNELINFQ